MVGNIICPEQLVLPPFDPFDPVTNTCTEADFIRLLEAGIYDSSFIGKFVTLSNSVDYDGGKWVIADVNHDSENTGQTNCYDLISVDCFHSGAYGSSKIWRSSTARTWLNDTFYPGFSTDIKSHFTNIKYNSAGTWYDDDKIILPSYKEVNGGISSYQDNEGIAYPIFTDNNSRIKYQSGTAYVWWSRSRYAGNYYHVWVALTNGSMTSDYYYATSYRLAPLIRVQ